MASISEHTSKMGVTTYKVRYRIDGRASSSTFTRRQGAERFGQLVDTLGPARALEVIGLTPGPKYHTGPTVGQAVTRYIDTNSGLSATTRANYRAWLRTAIEPSLGAVKLSALTRDQVAAWVSEQNDGKRQASTIGRNFKLLNAALSAAVARGEIPANPAAGVKLPRTRRRKEPVIVTDQELTLILKALPNPKYRVFIEFLAETGCRFGEAVAVTPADVNTDAGTVHFNKSFSRCGYEDMGYASGTTKTAASERTVRLTPGLLSQLDLSGQWLFTNTDRGQIKSETFRTNVWVPALRRSGIPEHRWPRLHDLRHTLASRLIDKGIPLPAVQKRLGHGSLATTVAIYAHVVGDSEARIVDALAGTV
jgi:integrase